MPVKIVGPEPISESSLKTISEKLTRLETEVGGIKAAAISPSAKLEKVLAECDTKFNTVDEQLNQLEISVKSLESSMLSPADLEKAVEKRNIEINNIIEKYNNIPLKSAIKTENLLQEIDNKLSHFKTEISTYNNKLYN
jgi:chromosome segregation ATPase